MQTSRIIARSPHRISLYGGGSDVDPFASRYGGLVINFAINLYTKVTIDPLFKVKVESYKGSGGLGGSASLGVAAIGVIAKYLDVPLLKEEIAYKAFKRELHLGWHGGCQDQYASALGGFNLVKVKDKVEVVSLPEDQIEGFLPYLCLFDTGMKRKSYEIQEGFKDLDEEKVQALWSLKTITNIALDLFEKKDYEELGILLGKNWQIKKRTNKVSNKKLDAIYDKGMKLGALGGKILGAGQGGHILFATKDRKKLIKNLGLKHIPFKVDYKGLTILGGSRDKA